ncbi:MAG: Plug domain-containing protein, partial [Gammaproteobacteria bacterium]|nr:Plug domain-containing protein [Gammaproteobacteria bacterium]
MIQFRVIKWALALILCLSWSVSYAQDNLYLFVFKNGEAQPGIKVVVGNTEQTTNEFGLANFDLPADEYEVGYYKNGELFALTEINLLENQQSQIFLTLTSEGEKVDLDLPLAAYRQDFEQQNIKQQTGPKGTLKLKLQDSKSGKPVVNAKLFFKGYAVEGKSGNDGIATIELSEGKYDISVIHPKFVMKVLKDVDVKANETQSQEVKLTKADIVLEEFVVTAPSVEGSLASTLTALKESSVIGEALSSEEFTKSGDASAADALKRVTGITIVDGKYVYVRGLGERYSVVML